MFSINLFCLPIILSITRTAFGCGTQMEPETIVLISDQPSNLTSPNYPGIYPTFQHCFWLVDAGAQNAISFRISKTFDVDMSNNSCTGDFVEIHDGATLTSPKIGQYDCTPGIGPRGQTSGRYMTVMFVSDDVDTRQTGFNLLLYQIYIGRGCGTQKAPETVVLLLDQPANVSSPNYPGIYPTFQHCFWLVDAGEWHVTRFRVDKPFDVDTSPNSCLGDFIEVHDGQTIQSPKIGQYDCTPGIGPSGESSGRYILVVFVSDGVDNQHTGFNLLLYPLREDLVAAVLLLGKERLGLALTLGGVALIIIVWVSWCACKYRMLKRTKPEDPENCNHAITASFTWMFLLLKMLLCKECPGMATPQPPTGGSQVPYAI